MMTGNIEKKRVVWVTPDNFMDTDFDPPLFKILLENYEIRWLIITTKYGGFTKESEFESLNNLKDLHIQFICNPYRQRDLRRLLVYKSLYSAINKDWYDLLYLSYGPSDPYFLPLFWALNKDKTICAIHEGHINYNFKFPIISKWILKSTYSFLKFAHLFSNFGASMFHKNFPGVKIFMIPMKPKSFGKSNVTRNPNVIKFLSFGIINYAKNIDLLIEAACNIYEQGYKGFKVSINGLCANWGFYQSKIRYPDLFDCDIRKIDNSEIPDLFDSSHYLVQPYRSTSQSGVLKIAFNYNVPSIASDLQGFKDEIAEGINGFLFKAGNVKDLERVMIKALMEHNEKYNPLLERMRNYINSKYSEKTINSQYLNMFMDVVNSGK